MIVLALTVALSLRASSGTAGPDGAGGLGSFGGDADDPTPREA